VAGSLRIALFMLAAILLAARPSAAQLQFEGISSDLNGMISTGYSANYGNLIGSSHNWTVGGAANFSGSFYNPNFLSFNAGLFLNQSRANSNFQSISDASGINLAASIFSGSHFPGSVNYSKAINSEGNFAVPGLANYVTHGNSDTFGINWSENLPKAPSLSAGFQIGTNNYSVYGTNDSGKSAFRSLNLHSSYSLADFNMGAYYTTGTSNSVIPQFIVGQQTTESHSDNSAYGFNVAHPLPLSGSASASLNRSSFSSNYLGSIINGTIDTINTTAGVRPVNSLSITGNLNYSDNLSGQLFQSVAATGGAAASSTVAPGFTSNDKSHSLDLMVVASYTPMISLQTSAYFERRTQSYLGENYGVESVGVSASYGRRLLDGNFNVSVNLTDNTSNTNTANALGFSTAATYSSQIKGWRVNGSLSYAQNVQTLLITYMNSYYNYSGNAARRWGRFNLSAGAGGGRTALTQQAGTSSGSQSYNASMGYSPYITAMGSYSKSDGQALATGAGLVPVPVPTPILPSDLLSVYGGNSYSFALTSAPLKGLSLTASYGKSASKTANDLSTSQNQTSDFNSLIQYQVRKLYFTSGYSRLGQGFSGSGSPTEVVSSFYVGVSRWFNFF